MILFKESYTIRNDSTQREGTEPPTTSTNNGVKTRKQPRNLIFQ